MTSDGSHFVEVEGVRIHAWQDGADRPGRAVVVLHGFTGAVESMRGVAVALVRDRPVVRIDLVGHGRSDAPSDPAAYRMEACVEQVAGVLAALDLRDPHLLGYSMGGRAALSLCAMHPGRVASALVVGASAGLESAPEREARARADEALAQRILDAGLESFVEAWMALPLFASQQRLDPDTRAAARAQRLRCRPEGLAGSLRGMGAGAMPPLYPRLPDLALPVCLVAGSEDARFAALAADLARRLPDARVALVPGAGHAAHLESSRFFARLAGDFFARVDAQRDGPALAPVAHREETFP